jgi:soluble lytic murein transglycosylase
MAARATKLATLWCLCALAAPLAFATAARAEDAAAEAPFVVTLREASALRDAGSYDEAAKHLEALAGTELGADVGLLRARLLLANGNPEGATKAAEAALALDPPAELRAHLEATLARMRLEAGDLAGAHAAQARAWDATRDGDYAAALIVELAQAYEKNEKPAEALPLYDLAWQGWPLAPASIDAFAQAQSLRTALAAPEPSSEALIARADRLRETFRCDLALPLYESVLARAQTVGATKARLERVRADCLFERRRYPEALEAFRTIAHRVPGDLDAQMMVGRSLARSGDRNGAIAVFEKLERSKDELTRARARSYLAIVVEDSDPPRSLALLRKIERQNADPALAVQARWSLAWADLRKGADAEALPRLDLLSEGPLTDIDIQRARYWRGVARLRSEDPLAKEAGNAQLRALADEVPLSYYGLLASERVGGAPLAKAFLGPRLAELDPPPLRRARWLADGGFPEIAEDELVSFDDETRLRREQRIVMARLLYRTGDPHRALQLIQNGFGSALEQGIDPTWRDAWELAWPLAYRESVTGANQEFEFDPALVYAVMREESAYRPEVSSPAGALGLMQLIPPTADRIAGELGLTGFEPTRLFDPSVNIRLGTFYLRSLVQRFAGSRPLAIASYNAGPEAVTRWLDRDGSLPPDVFVDSVPYGETRRYLRRVLRSYHMYRLLYPEAPSQTPTAASR